MSTQELYCWKTISASARACLYLTPGWWNHNLSAFHTVRSLFKRLSCKREQPLLHSPVGFAQRVDFHGFHSNLPTWSSLILKDSPANSLKLGSPQTQSGRWCTMLPLPKEKAMQSHCQSSRDPNMTFNPILKPFRWTARLKLAEFRIMFLIKQKIASILFLSYTLLKWPAIPNENCIGKFPETEVWH